MKVRRFKYNNIRESAYFQVGREHIYVTVKSVNDGRDPHVKGKYVWDLFRVSRFRQNTSQRVRHLGENQGSLYAVVLGVADAMRKLYSDETAPSTITWRKEHLAEYAEAQHLGTWVRGTHGQEHARRLEFERLMNEKIAWVTPDILEAFGEAIMTHVNDTGKSIFARLPETVELRADFEDGEVVLKREVSAWETWRGKKRVSSIQIVAAVEYDDGRPCSTHRFKDMVRGW